LSNYGNARELNPLRGKKTKAETSPSFRPCKVRIKSRL
jgi:hypothetical protein